MKRPMKHLHHYVTKTFKQHKNPNGYIAFLTVVILGIVGGLIATTLYLSGMENSQSSLLNIQEKEARYLADSCAEIAIQQIIYVTENNSTNGTFNIGQGTCSFNISDTSAGNKQINTSGTVENVIRKDVVVINPDESTTKGTVHILSWQENP